MSGGAFSIVFPIRVGLLWPARPAVREVTAVESTGENARKLRENSMRNGLRVSVAEEDVFSFLKAAERRGDRYDLIILDPPSFTARDKINDALRGYRVAPSKRPPYRWTRDVLVLTSRFCQGVRVVSRRRLFRREAFGADHSTARPESRSPCACTCRKLFISKVFSSVCRG